MSIYYTFIQGLGVTNLAQTVTHGLSITPSLLKGVLQLHQATNTATVPLAILTMGTNVVTIGAGVSTLMTCDLEVQRVHSIVGGDI